MPKEGDNRVLHIALDESNHGRYPEIIVAVCSFVKNDADLRRISGRERMTEEELTRYLRDERRDYCYASAKKGQIERNRNQLVEAAPDLIDELLRRMKKRHEVVDSLDIMLDGEGRLKEIGEFYEGLQRMKLLRRLDVAGLQYYPKSSTGEYAYSRILIAADTLANLLFRRQSFIDNIGAEERRIELRG